MAFVVWVCRCVNGVTLLFKIGFPFGPAAVVYKKAMDQYDCFCCFHDVCFCCDLMIQRSVLKTAIILTWVKIVYGFPISRRFHGFAQIKQRSIYSPVFSAGSAPGGERYCLQPGTTKRVYTFEYVCWIYERCLRSIDHGHRNACSVQRHISRA